MYIIYTKKGLEIERTTDLRKAKAWLSLHKDYYCKGLPKKKEKDVKFYKGKWVFK